MFDIIHSKETRSYLDEKLNANNINIEALMKDINNSVLVTTNINRKIEWSIYGEKLNAQNECYIKDYVDNILDVRNMQSRLSHLANIYSKSTDYTSIKEIVDITHKEIKRSIKQLFASSNSFNILNILTQIEMIDKILLERLSNIIVIWKFNLKDTCKTECINFEIIKRAKLKVEYDDTTGRYLLLNAENTFDIIQHFITVNKISYPVTSYYLDEVLTKEIYSDFQRHFVLCKEHGIDEFIIKKESVTYRIIVRNSDCESKVINIEITNISDIKRAEEINRTLAYYDSLTGIANRPYFLERLTEMLEDSKKTGRMGSVLFIDVDDFKIVNDTYGHKAGDAVLIHIANQLEKSVRGGDLVARYAGDEFTVICKDIREQRDLESIVQRIMDNIVKDAFVFNDTSIEISLSIGIAVFPEHGTDAETIVSCADVAMYKAKNTGKNRHRYYDQTMRVEELNKEEIRNGLKNAIARNELYLEYMLQYDSLNDRFFGIESLMRWNHPEKGLISPLEFIGIAEDSGMIIEMGYWALEESLKHLKKLDEDGYKGLVLGVNFTDSQFRQADLVEQVCSLLDKYNIEPHRLMIEIAERTSTWKVESTAKILKQLRDIGIQVCLDDFGTGLSSIIYLHEFSISTIKVDKSFIKDINDNDLNFKVTRSLLRLSETSDICIIAEGVENNKQYETLKELGCNLHQGYYISHPLTFDKLYNTLINKD